MVNLDQFERPAGLREESLCRISYKRPVSGCPVYTEYLMRALPAVARRVATNPDAYVYLAESIRAWPDQAALAGWFAGAGWQDAAWRDLTGGIVALHRGVARP